MDMHSGFLAVATGSAVLFYKISMTESFLLNMSYAEDGQYDKMTLL